jgi:hypothetical protein
MPSIINTSAIRNVHIYSKQATSCELDLCSRHQTELSKSIMRNFNELASTKLFQQQFKDFLPNPNSHEEVHVRVRITDRTIIIQKIDEEGFEIGHSQKVELDDLEDIDKAEKINQSILKKANTIYQDHLNESCHQKRDVSPLPRRAAHSEHEKHRGRSLSASDYQDENRKRVHLERDRERGRSKRIVREHSVSCSPESSSINPERSVDELALLKILKRDLEQQADVLRKENEILKASLPKMTSLISSENFDTLIQLSQTLAMTNLSGSTRFPEELKEEFMRLPEAIRSAIYYQTYLLVDPMETSNPWPIGQRLFEGDTRSDDSAQNLCRSHVIRHFLLHTLASDFANADGKFPPSELMRRFTQLPEEDKGSVYVQLEYIQPKGDDYKGPAHAFAGVDRLSVTNQERSIAINRVTLDRTAEYHRHHYREGLKWIEKAFQEAYEKLWSELEESKRAQLELEQRLHEATHK